MATVKNDGYIYGLDVFKFKGFKVGNITEDGIDWAGDKQEKVKLMAAQVKTGPVKIIKKNNGTNVLTFKVFQLDGTNCATLLGGTVDSATGAYTPSKELVNLQGAAEIVCGSGHVISIPNADLVAQLKGKISGTEAFGIECELEILAPTDDSVAAYTITPPAAEEVTPEEGK